MKNSSTHKAGRSLWMFLGVLVLSASLLVASGCITTAAIITIAVLSNGAGDGDYIATARIDRTPDHIYDTALAMVLARDDVMVDKQDKKRGKLEISKGLNKATLKISAVRNGGSEIIVQATAGEDGADPMELAHLVVNTLCEELGVTPQWPAEEE